MLAAAVRDLGSAVLRDGLQHHELTGLLEAIGRADARRETALADLAAAEKQKEAEDGRFTSQEAAREAEWKTCDRVAHEADDVLRAVRDEHDSAAARLGRIRDDRTRVAREAESAAAAGLDGKPRAAELRHRSQSLATEQRTLEEQVGRLERQLRDLREKSVALRAAAGAARSKLDQVIAARRQAASAMAATVAGHARDRGDAEREVAELTEQLGRVTAQVRPPASSLLSSYQRIDRLEETIADRNTQIAALDRSAAHYDQRKLLTGVGLVTSMLLATAAALWAVLK
jgi:chromosome segregation ATPase